MVIYEWQEQLDIQIKKICSSKGEAEFVWSDYSNKTRRFDGFHNKWHLCKKFNPQAQPDGDDMEDNFGEDMEEDVDMSRYIIANGMSQHNPTEPVNFVECLKGHSEDVIVNTTIAQFDSTLVVMQCHFGLHLNGSYGSYEPSSQFAHWKSKNNWKNVSKVVVQTNTHSDQVSPAHRDIIMDLIASLAILPPVQHHRILHHIWDLAVGGDLRLRMSHEFHIVPQQFSDKTYHVFDGVYDDGLPCTLTIEEAATTSVDQLDQYSLGWRPTGYQADYTDYVVYQQKRDTLMSQPRARAALLKGGIVWRLAVESFGWDNLAHVEVELDLIYGMYYIEKSTSQQAASWWPHHTVWVTCDLTEFYAVEEITEIQSCYQGCYGE
ncbi:hypothetical protein SERLADRAFT_406204 [Serpula lacrymans var. lacrymans S7.9]|uniref:Uncharacterized protein n=1 Tax=Serpula lacrymans var. lacrymans (strain S7.9) TaxID=578457 RepID=F8NKM8_SERL9|nr:uncharacterized protein SERLADRAFT_406204 [Serpula lacrymans var. lacrymans S7.9]EGO28800.1 hypothetical protein SERLADRAFT_406204 [Serpula lacrymans var. lacrymans S7.9]